MSSDSLTVLVTVPLLSRNDSDSRLTVGDSWQSYCHVNVG